jgi:hypothetical protein
LLALHFVIEVDGADRIVVGSFGARLPVAMLA